MKPRANQETRYQPLLCHMLDVAAVAGLFWDYCLTPKLQHRIVGSLGNHPRTKIMFLSGAHDLGKACPGFQKKVPELSQHVRLPFSDNDQNRPHGFITAHVLREALGADSSFTVLGQIAGGHHGVFPRSAELRLGRDTLGNINWTTTRQELLQEFANIVEFDFKEPSQYLVEVTDPAVVPVLAGFVSVVDWIGSNQDFFPCIAESGNPVPANALDYWIQAQVRANNALKALGWLPSVTFAAEEPFETVFSGFKPNTLQSVAIDSAVMQNAPYLMIVEAPTGLGKTETALFAADVAMCRGFARGMYIAMPTQATGNAMFNRVLNDYLRGRGHKGKLNLQLVQGDALLAQTELVKDGEIPEFKPHSIGDEVDMEAQSWFTAKKRPLLAPFGVGTIDQCLLSVLQTKHWFVRLFGLAGKVVIFDEVHAYDAYMSTILERLLCWLAELDCTVILLSATLPEAKRRALAKAYSGREDCEYKRYPRITLAKPRRYSSAETGYAPGCTEIPLGDTRTVNIQFAGTGLEILTETVKRQLEHGGCAAVICNTVDRSIKVYEHLRDNLSDTECSLFHARTLRMWRREREMEVLRKFGKGNKQADGNYINPDRPKRAVLVATQVIEQSLDLDFDLMISEIAPIDLLLQRLGRLHRHQRRRPSGLEKPQFILLCDAETKGPPPESFGKSIEHVYDRYILLRTWLGLQQRDKPETINLPTEMESLVEAVYGDSQPTCDHGWSIALEDARAGLEVATSDSIGHARHLVIRQPDDPAEHIERFNRDLQDDDDPATDNTIRAATREGEPSILMVYLADEEEPPSRIGIKDTRWLLDRAVSISQKSLFSKLLALKVPAAWQRNAHLRNCRLVQSKKKKGINVNVTREMGVKIL